MTASFFSSSLLQGAAGTSEREGISGGKHVVHGARVSTVGDITLMVWCTPS